MWTNEDDIVRIKKMAKDVPRMRVIPGELRRLKWWHWWKTMVGIRRFGKCKLPTPGYEFKLYKDITDEDACQRGPDGKPLYKITPLCWYWTLEEWQNRGRPKAPEPVEPPAEPVTKYVEHDWRLDGSCRRCKHDVIWELASREGCPRTVPK